MQSIAGLLQIAPQCCDAGTYLDMGRTCGLEGLCDGGLRPEGAYYWFSIPYRLGLSPDVLVGMNFLMMFSSVALSVLAFWQLLSATMPQQGWRRYSGMTGLLSGSLLIHSVFLHPTLFHTLSDPPSALLLLDGLWLLMLASCCASNTRRALLLVLAGLCLGASAWIRAFYLYPVLCGLAAYLVLLMFRHKRRVSDLCLFMALVPISTQYIAMYSSYHYIEYIQHEQLVSWSNVHLNQPAVGYDTIFPRHAFGWEPQHCHAQLGILNGLKARDFASVSCVLRDRFYFYLGTYEPETYKFSGLTNQLSREWSERVGDPEDIWWTEDINYQPDVVLAPDGLKTADQLTASRVSTEGTGNVGQWATLKANTPYTFSLWLWSPYPRTINLAITRLRDDYPIAITQVTLTPTPYRFSVTGKTLAAESYMVSLGRTSYRKPMTFGTKEGDYFFAWGAQLEESDHMTAYVNNEPMDGKKIRTWRSALLWLNLGVACLGLSFVIMQRHFWLRKTEGVLILLIVGAIIGESVTIIPEQRFGMVFMIFTWLMALAALLHILTVRREPLQ